MYSVKSYIYSVPPSWSLVPSYFFSAVFDYIYLYFVYIQRHLVDPEPPIISIQPRLISSCTLFMISHLLLMFIYSKYIFNHLLCTFGHRICILVSSYLFGFILFIYSCLLLLFMFIHIYFAFSHILFIFSHVIHNQFHLICIESCQDFLVVFFWRQINRKLPKISRKDNFIICETVHSIKKDPWYSHLSQRSRWREFALDCYHSVQPPFLLEGLSLLSKFEKGKAWQDLNF